MTWWRRWRERRVERRAAKERARAEFQAWVAEECAGNATLEELDPQLVRMLRNAGAMGPGMLG